MLDAFYLSDNANDYRTTCLRRVQQAGDSVSQKIVVITGGTGALGQEMAFALYNGGATVVLTGRSLEKAKSVIEKIEKRQVTDSEFTAVPGGKLVPAALDLVDYDNIQAFVSEMSTKYKGKIDSFVNNAGLVPSKSGYKESKYGFETAYEPNIENPPVPGPRSKSPRVSSELVRCTS